MKVIDITEILSQQTPPVNQPKADFEAPEAKPDNGNFEEKPAPAPPIESPIPEHVSDDDDAMPMDPEDIADMIVDGIDMVQQYLYPIVYDRLLFTKQEKADLREALKEIKKAKRENQVDEKGNVTINLTAYQQDLLEKQSESLEYEEEIVPLSEKEQGWLKKPLARMLKAANTKVNPVTGLIVAAIIITLPRVLPILGNLRKKQ